MRWACQVINPEIQSLSELAMQVRDPALQAQIRLLSFDGYQPVGQRWQGQPLFTAWQGYRHTQPSDSEQLAPLYPGQ